MSKCHIVGNHMSRLIFSMKNEYVLVYEDFVDLFFFVGVGVVWGIESAPSPSLSISRAPEGDTLIFSHIRRLGLFFGFKILNFNIFLVFQKNEYFWGYGDWWIFFGVITKLG